MHKPTSSNVEVSQGFSKQQAGVSILELIAIAAAVAIVSTFALMEVSSARTNLRLSNSSRQFARMLEKARADAVRRHGTASVTTATTTYTVTMDFDRDGDIVNSDGTPETRTYTLESGVSFTTTSTTITFNWRGRLSGNEVAFALASDGIDPINIDVTGSGDVTIGSERFADASIPGFAPEDIGVSEGVDTYEENPTAVPTPTTSTPTPTPTTEGDPLSTPTPISETDPTPTPIEEQSRTTEPTSSPTPNSTPTPTPTPECTMSTTTYSLSIQKNGGSVGYLTLSGNGYNMSVSSFPSNLDVAEATNVGGSYRYSITSNNNTRGAFTVVFTSSCGATSSITVNVTN
jgi:Tfp pilus assembly protein FimT